MVATLFLVTTPSSVRPVRLADHPGTLARLPDGGLAWTGRMTPHLLRAVLRAAAGTAVDLHPVGDDARATWIREMWVDVDAETLTVHVAEPRSAS